MCDDMDWDSFFRVHKDLPREGPGSDEDVDWALALAGLPDAAQICDAGAATGGDIAPLLRSPGAKVVALDAAESFVQETKTRFADEPRVRAVHMDMAEMAQLDEAPFDLIWCAGALYFLGLTAGLGVFRDALKEDAVVAFSYPAYFVDTPSVDAQAFWEGFDTPQQADVLALTGAAGYDVLGHRQVSLEGWEAYYGPMEARIAQLRRGADAKLEAMLDLCDAEAAHLRRVFFETGYVLVVARKSAVSA